MELPSAKRVVAAVPYCTLPRKWTGFVELTDCVILPWRLMFCCMIVRGGVQLMWLRGPGKGKKRRDVRAPTVT